MRAAQFKHYAINLLNILREIEVWRNWERDIMISNQGKKLAEKVIKLHDGKNFDLLKEMSFPSPTGESKDTNTEDISQGSLSS